MYDNSYSYRIAKRKYFSDQMESYGPYRFLLTLTFQHRITDAYATEQAEIFWRRLTKKIFEMDRRIPFSSINGYAVLEKASITKEQDARRNVDGWENPHFHMLIKDHAVFSRDDAVAIQQIQAASWKAARNLKTYSGRPLVSREEKGIDVRDVYSDGILDYLAEDSTERGWKREERMFLLDSNGFETVGDRMAWQLF